jgi:hypothetical protein
MEDILIPKSLEGKRIFYSGIENLAIVEEDLYAFPIARGVVRYSEQCGSQILVNHKEITSCFHYGFMGRIEDSS